MYMGSTASVESLSDDATSEMSDSSKSSFTWDYFKEKTVDWVVIQLFVMFVTVVNIVLVAK